MKYSLYLFGIFSMWFISACTKSDTLTPVERRAVGQYTFEKVTRHNDFAKTTNVTQDYHNMVLQLNDKKEAALIDQNHNVTYLGKFDVVSQTNSNYNNDDDDDNDNGGDNHTIIIDIKSGVRGGNEFHWVGENASFGNKLRFTAQKADGRYTFKLDKI